MVRESRFEKPRKQKPARRKGRRHAERASLNRLRGAKVKDVLKPAGAEPDKSTAGEETMPFFTVVPAPGNPGQFMLQSKPLGRDEADKAADTHNAIEPGGEEEKPAVPEFNKPGMPVPPFAERKPPAAPPMMPRRPMGGGMPPMLGGM